MTRKASAKSTQKYTKVSKKPEKSGDWLAGWELPESGWPCLLEFDFDLAALDWSIEIPAWDFALLAWDFDIPACNWSESSLSWEFTPFPDSLDK